MYIRNANLNDLEKILTIYAKARAFMREHGNETQWQNNYPPEESLRENIRDGKLKLAITDDNIAGENIVGEEIVGENIACVFYFAVEEESTYAYIEGSWPDNEPYGVVHRVASAKKGGATFAIRWAMTQCKNLRIDTHDDNYPMQNLVTKLGFGFCGYIFLADGSPRRAYAIRN